MKKTVILILVALGFIFYFDACVHKTSEEIGPDTTSYRVSPITPKIDTICFSSDILPLIIATCSKPGCHLLNSYSTIMQVVRKGNATKSDLYKYAKNGSSEMINPGTQQQLIKLDTASLARIAKWINQGAVNSVCGGCDTIGVKYSTHIKPIITNNCLGCHSTSGTLLATYDNVKAKVTDGKLYCSITWSTGCTKMPQGGSKLSDCQIRAVKIWIDAGAPNN